MCRLSSRLNPSRNPADFLAVEAATFVAGIAFAETAFFVTVFFTAMDFIVENKRLLAFSY